MTMNPIFSFEKHGSEANYHPYGFINESVVKPAHLFSAEDMGSGVAGGVDDLWSSYSFDPASPLEKAAAFPAPNTEQHLQDSTAINESNFLNGMQMLERPAAELEGAQDWCLLTEISDLLLQEGEPNHLGGETSNLSEKQATRSERTGNELSTEEVMRTASAHYIELSTPKDGDTSIRRLPFGISLSSFTVEEIKNVELATLVLAAAEKVNNQQYDRASNLIRQCHMLSSTTGNPVQRVVYYFCDALQDRIERETGRLPSEAQKAKGTMTANEVIKAMLESHPLQLICHKILPFSQVLQFTSMQAIIDNVSNAKRIHMISLSINHGLEWTILIQALSTRLTCPVESLKISAVGKSEDVIAPTGKRLSSFAAGLGLPFEFMAVVVSDMKDLHETMFELKEGEVVGVVSNMDMNTMIVRPETLDNVLRVIWRLRPCIMTVIDVEAKHNSPSFINRFTESLFYFSALFDCLDTVMVRSDSNRMALEGSFYSQGIMSIVAAEGQERVVRHVGISVWREYFARFGLVEADLNEYSLYQCGLLLKQFAYGDSCTLKKDGKSMLVGWKGTPLHFISAWKFQKRERRS